jgi:hypothetical protein
MTRHHGYRKTTMLVGELGITGMVAPMVRECRINGDWHEFYVPQVLAPDFNPF